MQRNPFFQSDEKDRPLNGVQLLLLQYAEDYGMSTEVLRSWQPSHTGFCAAHGEAVMYLIKHQGRTAPAAMREIDNLTANEAALLVEFFSHGVNRKNIIQHRAHYQFEHNIFQETLSYLVNKQKIPFDHAQKALKNLNVGQLYMLRDCYRHGLRTTHFAQANMKKIYQTYAKLSMNKSSLACRDALRYFRKIYILSMRKYNPPAALRAAAIELTKIHQNALFMSEEDKLTLPSKLVTSRRIRFLLRSAYRGVRADDYPAEFTPEQNKTYYSLLIRHAVHKPEALQEMKQLSEDKIIFLRRYYGHGVNYKRLRHFPHHMDYVMHFMRQFDCGAVEALDMLAPLSDCAMKYLHNLGAYGVTLNDVKALPKDAVYVESRRDKIITLIQAKRIKPGEALHLAVVEANDDDVIMAEPARRLTV